jgi:chromosome partitioning protein
MPGMTESCSVCRRSFEVQFRYQMDERDGGFAFYCSHDCHARNVRGEDTGGVTCDACGKRFVVELVSQVVRVRNTRRYACGDACRTQLLAEGNGVRLGALTAPPSSAMPVATSAVEAPTVASIAAAASSRRPIHAPRRLAIFNHKGGTGKTTTSVSIAAGLALRGLRVLLVDTDSQGNVGVSLGVKAERSLYHVLVMGLKPKDAAVNVRPNFDVIVSNETLAAAELYLAGRQNRDRVLRDRLLGVADDYDVLLLDCSPSLSLLNQNALVLVDGILVPVACDFLSLVGVRQVVKTVKNDNSLLHHPVQIYGVLPTFYDARARICRDAVDTMREHFGDRTFSPIRQTTKIKEAPAQGKTIFEYAPESHAAADYMRVVDRLIDGSSAQGIVDDEPVADEATAASA